MGLDKRGAVAYMHFKDSVTTRFKRERSSKGGLRSSNDGRNKLDFRNKAYSTAPAPGSSPAKHRVELYKPEEISDEHYFVQCKDKVRA